MKKNIFKRPFQCSLQTTIMSPSDLIKSDKNTKPSIEQVVKENIQLLQKNEDLPEEKILYEANGQEDDSSCQDDEPPPPIPCQNLIKKLRKDKKTKKEVSFDNNSTKEVSFVSDNTTVSDDDLTKMIRLVKRMKKLKV